jgi:hypothetical protein
MGFAPLATLAAALLTGASPGLPARAMRASVLGALPLVQARVQLDAGVRALNNFEDDHAFRILTRLLTQQPPSAIAAKAHVYLGMIAFNRLDIDGAREEFRKAVTIDPSMEPPLTMAPKARLAFSEARRAVTVDFARPLLPGQPKGGYPRAAALPAAPEAAVSAPEEGGHVPASAWWLGGAGIAVAVTGTVLFALAQSTLGGDHTAVIAPGVTEHSLPYSTVNSATTEGNAGEVLWAVGGALLLGGGIAALTGGSTGGSK